MPHCYLITVSAGSSLDQQSNNVTLFNLVEQVNVPPGAQPSAGSRIPLEIHAYLRIEGDELGSDFEMRFVLVSIHTGLETFSEPAKHRSATSRLRTRSLGLPFPPLLGHYDLKVDFRTQGSEAWIRDSAAWPISFMQIGPRPTVTH